MRICNILISIFLLVDTACHHSPKQTEPTDNKIKETNTEDSVTLIDLRKYYDSVHLEGMFVLYNAETKKYIAYNPSLLQQSTTPASTFNIITSLIAIEEHILDDENSILKWNGIVSKNPESNKDKSLDVAFRRNIDWFFWELRKKIGSKMRHWLDTLHYGNYPITGEMDSIRINEQGKDTFLVVSPSIRITPQQQLAFMERLYKNDLPFSKRSIGIIKKLMY